MYKDYFGFRDQPFSIAPDPRYLFMSRQHKEALAHLLYGVRSSGGFVLLTGEVGTGKTTVCRCLLEQLPKNVLVAFVINPRLTALELLATICDEFRIARPSGPQSVKMLVDRINAYLLKAHSAGKNPVLIIDEAQNLSADVLEQLRLLTNLETNRKKLLQIILLGQPELRDLLEQKRLRQLAQRITARYHLGPLNRRDVSAYVKHRLRRAGVDRPLFTPSVLKRLSTLTGGVPRLINVLCDRALLGASCEGATMVTKNILCRAHREVQGEVGEGGNGRTYSLVYGVLLVLLAAAAVAGWQFWPPSDREGVARLTPAAPVAPVEDPAPVRYADPQFASWVDEHLQSFDKVSAFQSMLGLWGLDYQPGQEPLACRFAEQNGLRCLHGKGAVSLLEKLDRPAVLNMSTTDGRRFYLTLVGFEGGGVRVLGAVGQKLISTGELERHWRGEYSLVWQAPEGYRAALKPGEQGDIIVWLDQKLARVSELNYQAGNKSSYEGGLLKAAKSFQTRVGLEDDGVVGPKTLIRLNSASGTTGPRLGRGEG